MQTMENRIRRLEFEEKRAQQMEQKAHQRADKMIDARKRHFSDLLMKKNHYYNLAIAEDKQRDKNEQQSLDRKNMIKLRRIEAMNNNRAAKDETLHSVTEERIKYDRFQQKFLEEKKEKKLKELLARQKLRKENEIVRIGKQQMTSINYQGRQEKEGRMQSAYKNRIDQLEQREMRLVD